MNLKKQSKQNQIARLLILVISFLQSKCEIIQFKGDWLIQDHYKMRTGEKLEFDFKISSTNNQFQNNTIYDMKIIDNNAEQDKKYTQLCKVKHLRFMPLYDQSKIVYSRQSNNQQSLIIDYIVFKDNILAYIFQNGKIVISNILQYYNQHHQNSNQFPDIVIQQIYEDSLIQLGNSDYVKLVYQQKLDVLMVYVSSGDVFCVDLSQIAKYNSYLNENLQANKTTKNKKEDKQNWNIFYQVEDIPKHEKAKQFISLNGHLIFVTINGKVKIYNMKKSKQNQIILQSTILDLSSDSDDFIDAHNYKNKLILLDFHKGIIFYEYIKSEDEYQIVDDFQIPIEGGLLIASQQLNTIVIGTKDKKVIEYFIDYENKLYIINNEIQFEYHINSLSIEEKYLFISTQGRNSNFFTPLNILKNTSENIEQHQTIVKFGQHSIQVKFTQLKDALKQQSSFQNNHVKQKRLKGYQSTQDYNNSIASAYQKISIFISLVDGDKLEVVPYYYESESLICSSESTQKILSNVNEKYEYTILYNSTDCLEKEKYYKVEKQTESSLNQRKSYCSSHGIVTFEVDFTEYEQEEFELGLVFLCVFIVSAILCFRSYKNQKFQQMLDLKERMSSEKPTEKRKRLNLHYEPISTNPQDEKQE